MEAPSSIPDCPSACESDVGDIDFDTTIDCRIGAGASLRRLTDFLFTELARPDSLLTNHIGAAPAEDLLVQSILLGVSQKQKKRTDECCENQTKIVEVHHRFTSRLRPSLVSTRASAHRSARRLPTARRLTLASPIAAFRVSSLRPLRRAPPDPAAE
jgi:hypothetical protein